MVKASSNQFGRKNKVTAKSILENDLKNEKEEVEEDIPPSPVSFFNLHSFGTLLSFSKKVPNYDHVHSPCFRLGILCH